MHPRWVDAESTLRDTGSTGDAGNSCALFGGERPSPVAVTGRGRVILLVCKSVVLSLVHDSIWGSASAVLRGSRLLGNLLPGGPALGGLGLLGRGLGCAASNGLAGEGLLSCKVAPSPHLLQQVLQLARGDGDRLRRARARRLGQKSTEWWRGSCCPASRAKHVDSLSARLLTSGGVKRTPS